MILDFQNVVNFLGEPIAIGACRMPREIPLSEPFPGVIVSALTRVTAVAIENRPSSGRNFALVNLAVSAEHELGASWPRAWTFDHDECG